MTEEIAVRVIATKGSTPRDVGAVMHVRAEGQTGSIGGGRLEWEATHLARSMLADGRKHDQRIWTLGADMGQCCGGVVTLEFVADADAEQPKGDAVWIWGAGHVGRAIAAVIAPLESIHVTLVDTTEDRMPPNVHTAITPIIAADPPLLMQNAPKDAHHLILTYSHDMDLALCHAALSRGFQSCGLIGSATKWARFRKRLLQLGHEDAQISRISCPIGDPKLGKHPQAIAIGVAGWLLGEQMPQESANAPHSGGT